MENSDDFLAESDFSFALQLINKPQRSLHQGDDFGKYKILKFLGCGGMGEVYLAHDSTLKRQVALKLLPPNIAADANRIRRFQIEARAASRIVQRNVAQVYEVGETESLHFIALEFIDGETLRRHLKAGSFAPEQVLPIAKQIAALQAAHKVGVIHRDLKPENIMLRSDGEVKVLDFSLAKLTRRASPSNGTASGYDGSFLTNSFKTEPGFLMRTTTYMSPEQAHGQEVDIRTDVWSFGVVLYEMLKGEPPFRGATGMDTIVALLTTEFKPFDDGGTDETYNKLTQIIHRALRKEPTERYQSIAELIIDLDRNAAKTNFLLESFNLDKNAATTEQIVNRTDEIRALSDKNILGAAKSDWRIEDNKFSIFGVRPRLPFIATVILLLATVGRL